MSEGAASARRRGAVLLPACRPRRADQVSAQETRWALAGAPGAACTTTGYHRAHYRKRPLPAALICALVVVMNAGLVSTWQEHRKIRIKSRKRHASGELHQEVLFSGWSGKIVRRTPSREYFSGHDYHAGPYLPCRYARNSTIFTTRPPCKHVFSKIA